MQTRTHLDNRLVRALREGADVLPEDLMLLHGYLRMIDRLLADKAAELEPSWSLACASAAEVDTLHSLEAVVAERAISVRAEDIGAVRAKLEIWRALAAGAPDGDGDTPRNRLIVSIEADLERLSANTISG